MPPVPYHVINLYKSPPAHWHHYKGCLKETGQVLFFAINWEKISCPCKQGNWKLFSVKSIIEFYVAKFCEIFFILILQLLHT